MLTLLADLYDPGPYAEPGGFPLVYERSTTGTYSGSTAYGENTLSLTRGNVTYASVPPTSVWHVVEARAYLQRTSGSGILDSFGWVRYVGSTLANFYTFAGNLTALSADSTRAASVNNAAIADALIVRDVLLFPGETLAWQWFTASDTTSWNVQLFVRGFLLPRGNLNRI